MLSACTGSFRRRYRSARSSAGGMASADNFLSSKFISIPLQQHLQDPRLGGSRKRTLGAGKGHAVGNHISHINTTRLKKSQGRLKTAAARTDERDFIHDNGRHVKASGTMSRGFQDYRSSWSSQFDRTLEAVWRTR